MSQVSCEVNLCSLPADRDQGVPCRFLPFFLPAEARWRSEDARWPGGRARSFAPSASRHRGRSDVTHSLHRRASRGPKRRAKGSTSAQTDVTTATHDTPIPIMHVDVHPSMHTPALSHMERTYLQPSHYACPPEELDLLHSVRTALHMHGRPRNLACLTASPQFRSLPQGTGLAFSRLRGPCVRSARRSPSPH